MSSSRDRPAIPSTASDLELLRAFEPVVRFTAGEQFFPMDVERYVAACSLWLYHPDDRDEEVVPEGELTMEKLVEPRAAAFGSVFYLRLVHPLSVRESAHTLASLQRLRRSQEYTFRTGLGRLARGGLVPRLLDALFSASLLVRGRVPKATAAAAALEYALMQEREEKYVYHGRVVRQSGWTVCQYWFFFAYNNWRSGFHGVNDHESDWELVNVYLYEEDGRLVPEWVAYASHDFHGADLRRRWDDRMDLGLEGTHPVVYAGAGSHASYFRAGEYQSDVPLPVPQRVRDSLDVLERFWRRTLGQAAARESPFRAPFIDFARGDGLGVGPGQEREWTPNWIDERTPWVADYRGLWGLYAQDPISGENAPAGPMYNRDGSPRPSWFDPLGFAGLDKVPPPPVEVELLEGLRAGRRDDPRAHIVHAAEPVPPARMQFSRAAELWAAVSLSLLLAGIVALIEFAPGDAWAGVIVLFIAIVLGESILRGSFVRTVNRVAVILALVSTVILLVHFWKSVLVGALVAVAVVLILQRVRELRA